MKSGSYAFRVVDFNNNSKVAAAVSTTEKYKDYVKVIVNELLLTIN